MALRATKPEAKEKRLKIFVYGPSGIGKTTAAIAFPNAYIIDTERGTDHYANAITKAGSSVFQSSVFDEVAKEVKELLTTKHEYRTLVIDPVTQIYNSVQEKWTRVFEKYAKTEKEADVQDFGMRYWGRVKGDFKALQRMLVSLDMNIIITAHQKDQYGSGMTKIGVTFDSMKGEDYLYDFVFRLDVKNGKRMAITMKERAEPGQQKFPAEFEWSYENFLKYYGKEIIEKAATPLLLATQNQIERIKALLEIVKIEKSVIENWFNKADVESWEEMPAEYIAKCIAYVEQKLPVSKES